jgi:hypothetical protein
MFGIKSTARIGKTRAISKCITALLVFELLSPRVGLSTLTRAGSGPVHSGHFIDFFGKRCRSHRSRMAASWLIANNFPIPLSPEGSYLDLP